MRTIEELRRFYEADLADDLKILESKRKDARNLIAIASAAITLLSILPVVALVVYGQQYHTKLESALVPSFLIAIAGSAACAIAYFRIGRKLKDDFKDVIIRKLVSFVGGKLSYSPSGHIPQAAFKQSGIFPAPTAMTGSDIVSGEAGKTSFAFSQVHAWDEEYTAFKGLFFVADFNKSFRGTTVVLPDAAERLFGSEVGPALQSLRKGLVKLEDPEFERLFVVYGSDQVEARYVLSTSLMRRIVDFRKKAGKDVFLSFTGSKVFIAVPYKKDVFEPRVFRTLLDFKPIEDYCGNLMLALGIIEDLNLNRRVWGKQ